MKKIFISHTVLDAMFAEGKADLAGDKLTIHARTNQVFSVTTAFKFLQLSDNAPDPHGLVGKIFTEAELKKINADIYMNSAIVNEMAYNVEPGFIGVPEAPAEAIPAAAPAAPPPSSAPVSSPEAAAPQAAGQDTPSGGEDKQEGLGTAAEENEMLTDYLLKIL